MLYYKREIGDYYKKAGRLNTLQHGSYTLLIDACYDRERFPTFEEAIEWVWAENDEEIESTKFILNKFFEEENGIYIHSRIKEEIDSYQENAIRNKRIAMEREEKRRKEREEKQRLEEEDKSTNRERTVNEPCTNRHLTINNKQLTTNKEQLKNKTKDIYVEQAQRCLEYLNEMTGRKYKTSKDLVARLKENSEDDVKTVIRYKAEGWMGSAQQQYLRPETLFRKSKFDSYILNAKQNIPHDNNYNSMNKIQTQNSTTNFVDKHTDRSWADNV